MKVEEFQWKTADGLKLYGKYWAPNNGIKGVVCIVHGMGEHINRYEHLGEMLTEHGYAVIGYDQRGHGKSEGKRGHTPSYEHLLNGVDDLLAKADEFFPETPEILYGHSMGGNLVINYVMDRQPNIAGLIVSSPMLKLAFDPPAFKLKLGKLMMKLYPAYSETTGLESAAISRIPEEVKKYDNDPLVHDKISTNMFFETYAKGLEALEHPEDIHLPTLIYHGSADRLTSAEATKEFARNLQGDITFKLFEGGYHELHNDLCKQELFDLMLNWLEGHMTDLEI